MFRVGILGAENSHAAAFAGIFNGTDPSAPALYPDIRVTMVGGAYPEANRKTADACAIETVADRPEDMLGKIDALMVTARDGKYHLPYAKPFLEAGIPCFIDKPFTGDPDAAEELIRLARQKNVPLTGGSSVKLTKDVRALRERARSEKVLSGDFTAPVSMVNEYGGFRFYASHLAESLLEIFGWAPEWVCADETPGGVTMIVHYPDFDVTGHYLESAYFYSGTVNTPSGSYTVPVSLDNLYAAECESFVRMLRTGEMDYTYRQLAKPAYLLGAIETALKTGARVPIGG